MNAAVI